MAVTRSYNKHPPDYPLLSDSDHFAPSVQPEDKQ